MENRNRYHALMLGCFDQGSVWEVTLIEGLTGAEFRVGTVLARYEGGEDPGWDLSCRDYPGSPTDGEMEDSVGFLREALQEAHRNPGFDLDSFDAAFDELGDEGMLLPNNCRGVHCNSVVRRLVQPRDAFRAFAAAEEYHGGMEL